LRHRRRVTAPLGRWRGPALVVALVIVPMLCHTSAAASFPCAAATAPRERLICANPDLSRADAALTTAYKAALSALSERGREAIREGQRQWLRYTQTVCGIGLRRPTSRPSVDCLKDEYTARRRQLDSAVVKRGGLVIRRVDLFKAAPTSAAGSGGRHAGFNTTVISYPQIDSPSNEGEDAWNKLVLERSRAGEAVAGAFSDPDDDHDLTVDYVLGSASPAMVSIRILNYDDEHGAHGSAADEQITWFIRKGRALKAGDVFEGTQTWKEALARLVLNQAKRDARKGGYDLPFSEPSGLANEVSDPAHWLITDRALHIRFNIDAFPHVLASVIPWSKLRRYLRSPLPFVISSD
jgi:uncharacterized protein YecT (DUF1311 family)